MIKNTGGPAFPHHVVYTNGWSDNQEIHGMDLRDYFAAKAMNGMIGGAWPTTSPDQEDIARFSYEMANAMLKAREA
jgi:hypothetical protein